MSERIRGRIATDETDASGHFKGLVGFRVEMLLDAEDLHGSRISLGSATSEADGRYLLTYERGLPTRPLEFVVKDIAGRILSFKLVQPDSTRFVVDKGRIRFADGPENEDLSAPDFVVFAAEVTGFEVTLGTGEATRTLGSVVGAPPPATASGHGLSDGNAVHLLVDKDVFAHAAQLFLTAQQTILFSQFNFSLPPEFKDLPASEEQRVVFEFHTPIPDVANPRKTDANDHRPERLLLLAADRGVDVRMLFHAWTFPLWLQIILFLLSLPIRGMEGAAEVAGPLDFGSAHDEARKYFDLANRPNITIRAFPMVLTDAAVMHTRMLSVDGEEAMCIGASYVQSYIDTTAHAIEAPIRGRSSGLPSHDVGVRIKGPAVGDLHESLRMLWNAAGEGDRVNSLPGNPPIQASGGDGVCTVQIVRTIPKDRVGDDDDPMQPPERGIFEGYLRAIAMAETLIYFENQYFIDCRISDALVNAMRKRPNLQVIALVNVTPDVWYLLYPRRQRKLIHAIRKAIGDDPNDPQRFAVFTRWSYEPPTSQSARPKMLPIYVHSKVAIVDDKWASVGSANIDYASMDRAIEVNANLIAGADANGQTASIVPGLLRRKLWAEHLGFFDASGNLDLNAAALQNIPPDGWIDLWKRRAEAVRQHLANNPRQPLADPARVLPWPAKNCTYKTPRTHLEALGIHIHNVLSFKSTRAFDFGTGQFVPDSKAQIDI